MLLLCETIVLRFLQVNVSLCKISLIFTETYYKAHFSILCFNFVVTLTARPCSLSQIGHFLKLSSRHQIDEAHASRFSKILPHFQDKYGWVYLLTDSESSLIIITEQNYIYQNQFLEKKFSVKYQRPTFLCKFKVDLLRDPQSIHCPKICSPANAPL